MSDFWGSNRKNSTLKYLREGKALTNISYVYGKLTHTPRRTRGGASRLLSLSTCLSDEVEKWSKNGLCWLKITSKTQVFP